MGVQEGKKPKNKNKNKTTTTPPKQKQKKQKQKTTYVPLISQSCEWIWRIFTMLWRLVCLMNLVLIWSRQGIGQPLWLRLKNKHAHTHKHVGLHSNINTPISFKFGVMIDTTKLYRLIPVWMTLTFILGHSLYEKVEISALLSLQTSEWIWMKFDVVPWPLGLSKLMQSNKQKIGWFLFKRENVDRRSRS